MAFKFNPYTGKHDKTLSFDEADARYLLLNQSTPQTVVPFLGAGFEILTHDLVPSSPGVAVAPSIRMTNSNVIGLPATISVFEGGGVFWNDTSDPVISLLYGDIIDGFGGTISYDVANNYLKLNTGTMNNAYMFLTSVNILGSDYPLLSGINSNATQGFALDQTIVVVGTTPGIILYDLPTATFAAINLITTNPLDPIFSFAGNSRFASLTRWGVTTTLGLAKSSFGRAGDNQSGTITQFEDLLDGTVKVYTFHDLDTGSFITISNTTNYNGTFEVVGSDGTGVIITTPFLGDDATGDWITEPCGSRMLFTSRREGGLLGREFDVASWEYLNEDTSEFNYSGLIKAYIGKLNGAGLTQWLQVDNDMLISLWNNVRIPSGTLAIGLLPCPSATQAIFADEDGTNASVQFRCSDGTAYTNWFQSSGGTLAIPIASVDQEWLGSIGMAGYDSGDYRGAAFVIAAVDGTPSGTGLIPGKWMFWTMNGVDNVPNETSMDSKGNWRTSGEYIEKNAGTVSRNVDGSVSSITVNADRTEVYSRNADGYVTSYTDGDDTWNITRNAANEITDWSVA